MSNLEAIKLYFLYVFSGCFIFLGFILFIGGALGGAFSFLIIGLLLSPKITNILKEKYNFIIPIYYKLPLIFIIFIIGIMLNGEVETQNSTISNNYIENKPIITAHDVYIKATYDTNLDYTDKSEININIDFKNLKSITINEIELNIGTGSQVTYKLPLVLGENKIDIIGTYDNYRKQISKVIKRVENIEKEKLVQQTYNVVKVIDGDTVEINFNGKNSNFRLIGEDSPESYETRFGYKECYGVEASEYLKSILNGKNVKIEFDSTQGEKDKYGRYLAYIFLEDQNINNEMIKSGYAWEYTYNKPYKYQDLFKASQKNASDNKLGLWAESNCNGERRKVGVENIVSIPEVPSGNTGNTCGNKRYCNQMNTCAEARFYLNSCGLVKLDKDGDGVPCENLCK